MLEAARLIIGAGPEDHKTSLLDDLEKATFRPINQYNSIFEAIYCDYTRPDQAESQVGPLGNVLDIDGCEIDIIIYYDRNRRLSEIEMMKKGYSNTINPNWSTFETGG